ncbi:MAG: hypothetical protein JXQ90_23680 [Cyclobacteriaceae bacterium]
MSISFGAIVDNAKDSLHDDGVIIIDLFQEENECVIRILDNGEGIDPSLISNVFDSFFSTKEVGQAEGLGLSIAHSLFNAK